MTLLELQTRRLSMERGSNPRASLRALIAPHVAAPPVRGDRQLVDLIDNALSLLDDHPLNRQGAGRRNPRNHRRNNGEDHHEHDHLPTN